MQKATPLKTQYAAVNLSPREVQMNHLNLGCTLEDLEQQVDKAERLAEMKQFVLSKPEKNYEDLLDKVHQEVRSKRSQQSDGRSTPSLPLAHSQVLAAGRN